MANGPKAMLFSNHSRKYWAIFIHR